MKNRCLNISEYFDLAVDSTKMKNVDILVVNEGEVYRISIAKQPERWCDWFIPSKLTGFNFYGIRHLFKPRLVNAKYFALCGGVGDEFNNLFVIGNGLKKYVAPATGLFFAFANDYPKQSAYNNNKGQLTIRIERTE